MMEGGKWLGLAAAVAVALCLGVVKYEHIARCISSELTRRLECAHISDHLTNIPKHVWQALIRPLKFRTLALASEC